MILLVDKPTGWTSHDVVKYIKIHGGYKKVGHAGTLDPLATGLLLILTDEDTKRMNDLVGHDKWYSATIDLLHMSDTRDADYHALYEEVSVEHVPTQEEVKQVLASFIPMISLPIPSFSAKKIAGRRMYKSARQGITHDVMKDMEIYTIELLAYEYPYVHIRCHVGSGTFIRSIAYELGKRLHTGGIITGLRREKVGDFALTDPGCIKNLAEIQPSGLQKNII